MTRKRQVTSFARCSWYSESCLPDLKTLGSSTEVKEGKSSFVIARRSSFLFIFELFAVNRILNIAHRINIFNNYTVLFTFAVRSSDVNHRYQIFKARNLKHSRTEHVSRAEALGACVIILIKTAKYFPERPPSCALHHVIAISDLICPSVL